MRCFRRIVAGEHRERGIVLLDAAEATALVDVEFLAAHDARPALQQFLFGRLLEPQLANAGQFERLIDHFQQRKDLLAYASGLMQATLQSESSE